MCVYIDQCLEHLMIWKAEHPRFKLAILWHNSPSKGFSVFRLLLPKNMMFIISEGKPYQLQELKNSTCHSFPGNLLDIHYLLGRLHEFEC